MGAYRQTPEEITGMPSGVPYIVGNELAERFSFYGMKTILVVFMTHHLKPTAMSPEDAKVWYHQFSASAYFFPILGAIVSDAFLGKYRTIMALSIVYCLGHLALAVDETKLGLAVGLSLIAIGSGGIKPCVSAHVGDQFGAKNQQLLERVFGWFYFSINFGSFFSTLLTPVLLEKYGPSVAFGLPGVFMALATIVFWLGRNHFAHIPPAGSAFVREVFSAHGLRLLGRVSGLVLFIAMFWALYDQNGSAWVLQAERMDLEFLGIQWLPSQVQAINPILVLILIPLTSYVVYPQVSKVFPLTSLRKIGIGFFLTVLTFLISAHIEARLDAGEKVNIGWQLFAYAVLTLAEVLVYGTGLEFFYAQAPNRLKSFVMALFLLSVSLGNLFTSLVNRFVQNEDGSSKLSGPSYYLFFAGLMFVTSVLYIFYAAVYRSERHIQGTEPAGAEGSA
ncbi:MAG TPA: POT family MFS transporter [Polyangiales bacterium]|nr:POT family MFS transporter [Polyangiales bacterium]